MDSTLGKGGGMCHCGGGRVRVIGTVGERGEDVEKEKGARE